MSCSNGNPPLRRSLISSDREADHKWNTKGRDGDDPSARGVSIPGQRPSWLKARLPTGGTYEEMKRLVMEGRNSIDIADRARVEGIADIRQSALKKCRDGMLSIVEMNRVTQE